MAREQGSDLNFLGASRILNLPNAVGDQEPATFAQVKAAIEGLAPKDDVRVSTQANINLAAPGATIDGITMASGDRFLVRVQDTPAQNGIYIWNGASSAATRSLDANTFDELEGATTVVTEGSSAGVSYRQTAVNGTLGTTAVAWTVFGGNVGPASEGSAGAIAIATQSETNTGTVDNKAITPLKLANWTGRKLLATGTLGDGSATTFTLTHGFGTRNVQVEVFKNSGSFDTVFGDVTRPSVSAVGFAYTPAPAAGALAYVILG